jgi:3-hydroxybutyryl-CoA dehydrogenase
MLDDIAAAELTIGVIGAGAMGQGIAQIALQGGLRVRLHDVRADTSGRARASVLARLPTSAFCIPRGCRLPWNMMNRLTK